MKICHKQIENIWNFNNSKNIQILINYSKIFFKIT